MVENIFKNVDYEILNLIKEYEYNEMDYDSRNIKENDIFIALIGANLDGHNYINQAINNGAKLIIVERKDIKYDYEDVNVIYVNNLRLKLGLIASNFYNFPQNKLKILGVTGTNGKTTTTYILENVLKNSARIGTTGYRIGNIEYESKNTTPESLDLIKLMKKCVNEKIEYFIMEVSSHALSLGRVNMLEFDGAIFTNLTQDHLDFHKNMEEYFLAKASILNHMKKDSKLIINKDDVFVKRLSKNTSSISLLENADLKGEIIEYSLEYMKVKIVYKEKEYIFNTKLMGEYNLLNILGAIMLLININFDIEYIIDKISKISSINGRFELIENDKNVMIVVDYAHSPDGLLNILKTLYKMKKNRLITLFGAGGDRDKTKRPIMASVASKYSDFIYLTSDNPRTENPEDILDDLESGFENYNKYFRISDRKCAIITALDSLLENDILLIAGKGHENYQIIGNEKKYFDDRQVVKEYLLECKEGRR